MPVMKIRELKQRREAAQAKAADILDRAQTARREMTSAEKQEFDRTLNERDQLDKDIKIAEEQREADRAAITAGGHPDRGADAGIRFTTADGRTVRGVVHGESFTRAVGRGTPAAADFDSPDLSLGRALVGIVTGDRSIMEREMRAQVVAQDPAGGFFVQPELANVFIDQARARSVLSDAGAITIPLGSGETRILRVTADPAAAWKAELGALAQTDVTFGSVQLFPKVLGCVVDISEELVEDGANAAQQIEAVLSQAIADQLDRSLFRGIDSGVDGRTFTGILDDPDVNTIDMAGAVPAAATAYDEVIDGVEAVENANGAPDVHILSPRTWGQYSKLKDTTNQPIQMPAAVAALRHLRTTQVPTDLGAGSNQSVSVVGNFRSAFVILGIRSAFRVEVSREAGNAWENLGRKVRIWGRADMAIGRPSHLSLIQKIGAPA